MDSRRPSLIPAVTLTVTIAPMTMTTMIIVDLVIVMMTTMMMKKIKDQLIVVQNEVQENPARYQSLQVHHQLRSLLKEIPVHHWTTT